MQITNTLNLPDAIVRAVVNDRYTRGQSDISVTQLIAPPRKVALERRHASDLVEDASNRIWSLLGQAIHTILERAGGDALTEERLYMNVGGWVLSGAFDTLTLDEAAPGYWKLTDYKVSTAWALKDGGKLEWTQQLNVLARILRANGFEVAKAEVVLILRDWSKLEAARDPDYPQFQVAVLPVALWPPDEQQAFIEHRISLHQRARSGDLPLCSDEERWLRPDKWAVMKDGRKTALRLLGSEGEAIDWCLVNGWARIEDDGQSPIPVFAKGISLVKRPGEAIRCKSYCAAAPFCSQATAN